jgi:hypothetical protein
MYTVKQKSANGFEVASWGDYSQPLAVYRIVKNRCNCPASFRSRNCKHLKIVQAFQELESGAWAFEFVGSNIKPYHLPLLDIA